MKRKRLLRAVLVGALLLGTFSPFKAVAQTDVTSTYLTNANFDNSSDYVATNVYTYANDANNNNAVSSCQDVTGWTKESTGDGKAGGVFQINSGKWMAGDSYAVPSTNANGGNTGGALGLAGCWGNSAGYYQALTLPAGLYRISYMVYNAGPNIIANYENTIGFVEDAGTTHYADIEFYKGEWTEGIIYLNLTSSTPGKIHLGYTCANVGSGNSPKLFVDYIKIEAYNPALGYGLEDKTSSVSTTSWGTSGKYTPSGDNVQGYEMFQWAASLATGVKQTQTISNMPNGTYQLSAYVGVSSTSGRDNTSNVITDYDTKYVSFHANNVSHGVPGVNRTDFTKYDRAELNNVSVTDGNLHIYLNEDVAGPNWLVIQIKKLLYLNSNAGVKLSYGSANFPIDGATSVTADYWYAFTVPMNGDYTITSSTATTVYYSQDGTQAASGGTYTSLSLSANTASNAISFTAGTLYVKASDATTLTIAAASYSYNIGSAIVSHNYVQGGEKVTVTYPNAATNNPSASLSVSTSGVKFNGSTPAGLTATANGFTFTVPSGLAAATDYTLAIPAGIVGYAAGSTYNAAQEITIKTPAVFDGTYFLKNSATNQYLARGSSYGTRGYVNDWGNPLKIQTDADGFTTIQFCDNNRYLFKAGTYDVYADQTTLDDNARWTFTLSDGKYLLHNKNEADNKYVKLNNGKGDLFTDGTDASQIVKWIVENPSDGSHLTQMQAVKDAQAATAATAAGLSNVTTVDALESAVSGWTAVSIIKPEETVTTSAESYNSYYEWGTKALREETTVAIAQPGLYRLTIQAFGRPASNAVTFPLHQIKADQTQAYVYFGNAQTLLASAFSVEQTAITDNCYNGSDGYYYPNGQPSARAFFNAGNFTNTVWVYITEAGNYKYGIQTFGNSKGGLEQWTCWTDNTISLTLYVNGNVDYVQDGVHKYIGTYTTAPALETTDATPVVDVTGATFSSGSATVNFTNPNGLVFANSNQVNESKNVVVNGTCASLELEKGHPFINPKEFTATEAKYAMADGELAGGNFATLMLPFAASLPSGGSAYALSEDINLMDGNIRGTSVSSIPANSPVLVKAAGDYTGSYVTVPVIANEATYTNGQLVGTYTPMTAVENIYVLQNHTSGEGVAFYLVGSTKPTVNPFRAYIKSQGSNARALHVVFDDEAQGIENINDNLNANEKGCYDLQGRRVAQPTKGLYIVNGRKTVIK